MSTFAQPGPAIWAALCGANLKSFWLAERIAILRDAVQALTAPDNTKKPSLAMFSTIARERSAEDQQASFPPRWVQLFATKTASQPRDTRYLTSLALAVNYLAEVNEDCRKAISDRNIPFVSLIQKLALEPAIDTIIKQSTNAPRSDDAAATATVASWPRQRISDADRARESLPDFHPFGVVPPNTREVDIHFFRNAGEQDALVRPRTSYYVIYRHSTIKSHIVKSFLAVCSPLVRNTEWFTFVHVYTDPRREIKRISTGSISSLNGTLYLIGRKILVPFSTSAASMLSVDGQVPAGLVQGVKIMAIPHVRLTPNAALTTGVYLSNAGAWQPIAGRFAMVHLGFPTLENIDETPANIAIMDSEKALRADLDGMSKTYPAMVSHYSINEVHEYVMTRMTNVNQCDLQKDKRWRSENAKRALVPESVPPGLEPGR